MRFNILTALEHTYSHMISTRLTNPLLLIAIGFLVGGFAAINKFGTSPPSYPLATPTQQTDVSQTGPDPLQVGEHVVTQKSLYTILFVVGIPLLWFASPLSTIFWIVGASALLILGHASLMEPGIESEYAQVSDSV